ncbi:fimbria/pilus chaperone family protein [Ewingella americana]|uniref:fimbria/pilus chaperone family protein n=1 Tax=Ewingella americana TaxID=41202 RepID=UPI001E39CA34|nr:fimbria/pilus chaperone family protein [Ewingella americana]
MKNNVIKYSMIMAGIVLPLLPALSHATGMVPETSVLLIDEAEGGGSMNVKNTDDKAALLYTTIQEINGSANKGAMLVATQPIVRLEANQTQRVRFVLNNTAPLTVEQYKRVIFEGIPQAKAVGKKQITTTIRQNLPVIIHPKGLPEFTTPWEKLEWKTEGKVLKVTNPSAYVVRMSPQVVTQPSNVSGSFGKTFILPGETLTVTLKNATTDKQVKMFPSSRFGFDAGSYVAALK